MVELWWDEARKYNVLPLADVTTGGFSRPGGRPRRAFKLHPSAQSIPVMAVPNASNRSHRITAYVDKAEGGVQALTLADIPPQELEQGGVVLTEPVLFEHAVSPEKARQVALVSRP